MSFKIFKHYLVFCYFSIFEERDDEWPEYGKMLDTEIVEVLERAVMIKLPKVRRPIKVPLRSLTIQQVSTTAVLNLKVRNFYCYT